ncbi:MAG: fumarate hydratase [Planctomycetes bacterium]|nr:fumarate hydratase [Planctomycetota bacterium]
MATTIYEPLLPVPGFDIRDFRRLPGEPVAVETHGGRTIVRVRHEALRALAREAFRDIAFFLRRGHLERLAAILQDPGASPNDRFVAEKLLENAAVAARGVLPMCQDTGTATVMAWKGEDVATGGDDARFLAEGAAEAWGSENLRYSQLAARSMFDEVNTGDNLPAQIDIQAVPGAEYRFLFIAKGGGSANKTALYQESKALLNERALDAFLRAKIDAIGVAACPPYHLAVVVGGTSPEANLKVLKLATAGWLDELPEAGSERGIAFRDPEWEARVLAMAAESGWGAQFGGRHLALDARVIRLPRHAGSCPVSIGVSCSADRNIRAVITRDGVLLERLEEHPERFLPQAPAAAALPPPEPIDLNAPMMRILQALSNRPVGTRLSLSGPLVVARDAAHARLARILEATGKLPDYFALHPIYYAGPAKTPAGMTSGSFGPTTAQRMDAYIPEFMRHGASLITLAKGNRAAATADACRRYGGFYLGTIGGAAALAAQENIARSEVLDFADLGMEAIRLIEVRDLPAFIICDDKGNDLYAKRAPKA